MIGDIVLFLTRFVSFMWSGECDSTCSVELLLVIYLIWIITKQEESISAFQFARGKAAMGF